MQEIRTRDSTHAGFIYFGLAVWITAVATAVWLMVWCLSGEPWGSFLAVVGPMSLVAAKLPSWPREETELARSRPAVIARPAPSAQAPSAS